MVEDYRRPPVRVYSDGFRVWRWGFLVRWRWLRGLAFGVESGGTRWRGTDFASPGVHLMLGIVVVTFEHAATFAPMSERPEDPAESLDMEDYH